MKNIFILVFLLSASFIIAQPANDDCINATDIGSLPTPSSCPVGMGAAMNVSGTLISAVASSPYIYQTDCFGASAMSHPANDVWYKFTTTGQEVAITISSTFSNPNVAIFSGTCLSLGGVGGCAVGTGGTVTLTVEQLLIGSTYYLLVSGNGSETGTFNMSIRNNSDCDDCRVSSELIASPPPTSAGYAIGQTINFCYHVSQYLPINTNWLHGVQISFGAGWNLSSLITTPPPSCQSSPSGGVWLYSPTPVLSAGTGATWPAGFYFDANSDGNPGNNYGDNCTGTMPSTEWNFCFSIQTLADSNLRVVINTTGDGESGSWLSTACVDDDDYVFQVSSSTGTLATSVNDLISNTKVTIYPNPFSSSATIKIISASKIQNAELIISDVYGSVVKRMTISGNEAIIDRDTMSSGLYFYKLINSKEVISNGKFLIK